MPESRAPQNSNINSIKCYLKVMPLGPVWHLFPPFLAFLPQNVCHLSCSCCFLHYVAIGASTGSKLKCAQNRKKKYKTNRGASVRVACSFCCSWRLPALWSPGSKCSHFHTHSLGTSRRKISRRQGIKRTWCTGRKTHSKHKKYTPTTTTICWHISTLFIN